VKASASIYSGASSVQISGLLAEARVEMPAGGSGSIHVRSGSSEQVGSFPVDQSAGDDSSMDPFDGADAPSTWVDSIERELRQLASSMGVPLTLLMITSVLVPCLCCIATTLVVDMVLSH
jgi:hypothetical protein